MSCCKLRVLLRMSYTTRVNKIPEWIRNQDFFFDRNCCLGAWQHYLRAVWFGLSCPVCVTLDLVSVVVQMWNVVAISNSVCTLEMAKKANRNVAMKDTVVHECHVHFIVSHNRIKAEVRCVWQETSIIIDKHPEEIKKVLLKY